MKKINEKTKSGYVAFVKKQEPLALCGDINQLFIGSDSTDYIFSRDKESLKKICSGYNYYRTTKHGIEIDFDISYCEVTEIVLKRENKNKNH